MWRQPRLGTGRFSRVTTVVFVGVTTAASLVGRVLPEWGPALGMDCTIRGLDIALEADDGTYVQFLRDLLADDRAAGAVITSHKVGVFRAGRTLFAELDPLAVACGEVNAIRRTGAGLLGWARDPISVGRVVDRIWPQSEGEVVCLGAGGTARALAQHLFSTRAPVRFVCADRVSDSLERLTEIAGNPVAAHLGDGPWDELIESAPPGSLIVNATGMGKDRPGSPISGEARFPRRAVVWELNYRGDLKFLDQARTKAETSELEIHDGWQLFCHGWAAALSKVLDLAVDDEKLGDRFSDAAEALRPGSAL